MEKIFSIILGFFFFFILNFQLYAWNEPDKFKGVSWDSSEDELKKHVPDVFCLDCINKEFCDRICGSDLKIGDVLVEARFYLRNNKFYEVTLSFSPDDFSKIKSYFVEKYGKPTNEKEEEFKTRGGLLYTNLIMEWKGKKIIIELQKYHSNITESSAHIQTIASYYETLKRMDRIQRKGAADL